MPFNYGYARPAIAVDCVVFGIEDDQLKVLLIERGLPPFLGSWALPGGFVRVEETVDEAAWRELVEEAGVRISYLEQLYTFGDLARDPRERVISVAYFALINPQVHPLQAATDAANAAWFSVAKLPSLAFDHQRIVEVARERLQAKVRYQPIGFGLLPEQFSLTQLQEVYQTILGRELDKRNFRKKVLSYGFVVPTQERETNVRHRAAQLYRFDREIYEKWKTHGYDFEV